MRTIQVKLGVKFSRDPAQVLGHRISSIIAYKNTVTDLVANSLDRLDSMWGLQAKW